MKCGLLRNDMPKLFAYIVSELETQEGAMGSWAEKQIADLERTRLDMYRAIQWAEAECRKPSVNIVNLFDLATAEIQRLGGVPKELGK